jgi:hypothetical protein
MSTLISLLHDGAAAAGTAGVIYVATVATAAFAALGARTPARRQGAREVLKILLRRGER